MNGGTYGFLPAWRYLPGTGSPLPPVATPCPTPSLLITFSLEEDPQSWSAVRTKPLPSAYNPGASSLYWAATSVPQPHCTHSPYRALAPP